MEDLTSDTTPHDEAQRILEARIDALFHTAYAIVERHWQFVRRMESRSSHWEDKSSLQLRCEKVGNSIRADWCGIRWHGSKAMGNRGVTRVYIAKPKGAHGYALSKIMAFAKEWEKPMIEETEARLAAIRREAGLLVKAIAAIRIAKRAVAQLEAAQP